MDHLVYDVDPAAGMVETIHLDETFDRLILETSQDVTPLIEENRAFMADTDERAPFKGDLVRVASIPMNLFMELDRIGITRDPAAFRRWLNDRDNSVFRTRPGTI
jgi:hypothetical protein